MDIAHVRNEFTAHPPLMREDLLEKPVAQFERWFNEALSAGVVEPNAFVLGTCVAKRSFQRTVLLKYFDENGFVFFTNYHSQKAQQITQNPQVSMLFPWFSLQRQVRIEGRAEKISSAQSLRYFLSRPKDSQIGAWSSPQSEVIDSRALLLNQWQNMKQRFAQGEIPLPDFWGGYRIYADYYEFWQGQPNRLHDRFRYRLDNQNWQIERLAP